MAVGSSQEAHMSDVDQCPYCELRFARRVELKDHIEHDHPSHQHVVDGLDPHERRVDPGLFHTPSEIGHQCPACELRFAFASELRQHMASEHQDRRAGTAGRP
jgi:hypothetical protein